MARKGIHPLMRTMTVVLRNGSSFRASTVLNRHTPWKLQVVSGCGRNSPHGPQCASQSLTPGPDRGHPVQDPTSHPFWTGEETGISVEDARMARIMERYGDVLKTPAEKAAAAKKAAEEESVAGTASL